MAKKKENPFAAMKGKQKARKGKGEVRDGKGLANLAANKDSNRKKRNKGRH